jgi:uncharacterized repeat protein (TIGR03803 family)
MFPFGGLVQGSDSNFYGTTLEGGSSNSCLFGCGTIFKITPQGTLTTLLRWDPSEGVGSYSSLAAGRDGNFYGTSIGGGSRMQGESGTVYRITAQGTLTSLWQFTHPGGDPYAGLVLGSDGNFYGTTEYGGTNNLAAGGDGTVFKITPQGTLTTLWQFGSHVGEGQNPLGVLVQDNDGNFYGTTLYGGTTNICTNGCGTVFKLSTPLNPAPNQIMAFQPIVSNLVVISVASVAGEMYELQFSNSMNPTNWGSIASTTVTNSIGGLLTLTNRGGGTGSGSQGFFRFKVTP